jgi:peptidase M1-like protein
MAWRVIALAISLAWCALTPVRVATQEAGDGTSQLIARLEAVVQKGDRAGFASLLALAIDPSLSAAFADGELRPGVTRAVIQERERRFFVGGGGQAITVDIFQERGDRGRISTWSIDLAWGGAPDGHWQIADLRRLSTIEGLHRLSLAPDRQFTAKNMTIKDGDLELTLVNGSVFVSEIEEGTTAIVFNGAGEMTFRPAPESEKTQLRIFSGADVMQTRFDAAYLRVSPDDFDRLVSAKRLVPTSVSQSDFRKADRVFREDSAKSYTVDLGDLSGDAWAYAPAASELVAEIHTRRFGTLTYAHSATAIEDVSLFDRARRKTIALYASSHDSVRADRVEFDVRHYDIDIALSPELRWLDAQARLTIRARAPLSSLTLRLAESLTVQSVSSDLYGRLFSMRVRGQNAILVALPEMLAPNAEIALTVRYRGRIDPESPDSEVAGAGQGGVPPIVDSPFDEPEPSFLYSGQSNWYPRPAAWQHATATLRITVPADLGCIATGQRDDEATATLPADATSPVRRRYVFNANEPVRYFAFLVSRFVAGGRDTVTFAPGSAEAAGGEPSRALAIAVEANPGHSLLMRTTGERTAAIVRFYRSLVNDSPYSSFTVALTEHEQPGGHSPAYFAVVNIPTSPRRSFPPRSDPASFDAFPDFFLAHELAHQWWGQAVGWRSYRDQWLSEGFAQYFAALYAREQGGDELFRNVMRQMRRWAQEDSAAGPIALGTRLGHIQGDSRILRAVVYDKGAIVLHTLRGLVGDDAFFGGLRRFYRSARFRSVGTEDFRAAMEEETGRPLDRFFERWVYGVTLPRVRFGYRVDGRDVILRIDQSGEIFDLLLTVTLQYADRPSDVVRIPVSDQVVELRVPLAGSLRSAEIGRDDLSLAEIARN